MKKENKNIKLIFLVVAFLFIVSLVYTTDFTGMVTGNVPSKNLCKIHNAILY